MSSQASGAVCEIAQVGKSGQRVILAGPEPLTESLTWHDAIADKPDAELQVLVWAVPPGEPGNWGDGWWDGEDWRWAESGGVVAGVVTHWAEPVGPAAAEEASR